MTIDNQLQSIKQALETAIARLKQEGVLLNEWQNNSTLTRTKDQSHGDFSANTAMLAAKAAGQSPRELAAKIIAALPALPEISKVELAGPGFINFFLNAAARFEVIGTILTQESKYGLSDRHVGQRIHIEFVSANPTSSLHVGHGRGAAYGMSVANLLEAVGYQAEREYYVNDAGRQMDILAASTYLRYLQQLGHTLVFPQNGYRGDYVIAMAQSMIDQYQDCFSHPVAAVFAEVPADVVYGDPSPDGALSVTSGDKEQHIDGLIVNIQRLLGADYAVFHQTALQTILDDIRNDLSEFNVHYDGWFSEASLKQKIEDVLAQLQQLGHLYRQEGHLWFKSTAFGDEKDRVVRRANGQTTYFAADIAYHAHKFERGLDRIVNVWGSDHHGYIARVKAAMTALGFDAEKLTVLLVQFVTLWRGSEMVQMSSRSGQFVTLRELRSEVGNDAARFYYVMRKSEQHVDFDLNLVVSQNKDNVIYYIQYAHARICRMLEKFNQLHSTYRWQDSTVYLPRLSEAVEEELLAKLAAYPAVLYRAASQYEPHVLGGYLKELASLFHGWYNEHKVLGDDAALMQARIGLSLAVKQVIANGLLLLGVSAPHSM